MTNITRRIIPYFRFAQRYGVREAFARAFNRLGANVALQVRATWWAVQTRHAAPGQDVLRHIRGEWHSVEELVQHLAAKTSVAFLFTPNDRESYVAALNARFAKGAEATVAKADAICRHRFDFLGRTLQFGDAIDWCLDPESGCTWPNDYYEKLDRWMWSDKRIGDLKLPSELNRHQHWVTLGKAYWITGDERYANECAEQLLSWVQRNPVGIGINWYSSLEIGVRLISWCLAFHFFRTSQEFMHRAGNVFLQSMYEQASFLRHHLTLDWAVRNNHIIGEATALIFVGALFSEFSDANEWLATGLRIFDEELRRQTHCDGANKEQATGYHRFVLDFALLVMVLARRGAVPVASSLWVLLEKMMNYAMVITTPNGSVPMIGDADDGRGYILSDSDDATFLDLRNTLAIGAVLFRRPDLRFVAGRLGEDSLWLLGPDSLAAFAALASTQPEKASYGLVQAGQYVVRDDWSAQSDYAFLKSGPFGLGGEGYCAHGHCDLLSPVLHIQGQPILVDSGTFSYHGPWRDVFRLTPAHNTLVVDGYEQATPRNEFSWNNVPQAKCLEWTGSSIVGTLRAAPGVWHRREVQHPRAGVWEITDHVEGEGAHDLTWYFHLAPSLTVRWSDVSEGFLIEQDNEPRVIALSPTGVQVQIRSSWYSPSYGVKEPAPMLVGTWRGGIPIGGMRFHWAFLYIGKAESKSP
ncbi:MAG: alginate lyase family protein [Anaerolineae bacterium]